MKSDKITALIGFAVKSRKLLLGADNTAKYKGKIYSVFYDGSLSEKSLKEVRYYAGKQNAVIIKCLFPLEDAVSKKNCKTAALTDENMHKGIMAQLEHGSSGYIVDNADMN